jgi:Na+-transporting NADH:ubiquinone oxidoreductase subunit A
MPGSVDLESKTVTRAALLGRDYRGVKFELLCEQGDEVGAGSALMCDRRRPEIRFCAPVSGRIARIERGARRKLVSLQIDVDDSIPVNEIDVPVGIEPESLRQFMLASGAWSTLRTRPFGNIPDPDARPAAIFVTALDNAPFAPQVTSLIDSHREEFDAAVIALAALGESPLYVCHASGHALALTGQSSTRYVPFNGAYMAGLPGFHINQLCPIGFAGGEVWRIGYQDVIALGHLLQQGRPWLQRVISLCGNAIRNPRSLRVPPGAALGDLLEDEVLDGPTRILDGAPNYGRALPAGPAFLGATQRQLSVLFDSPVEVGLRRSGQGPIVPAEGLDALAPPGIYAVPLMRALQLGDVERARELGALELEEEDLAPLSLACVSNSDYGTLLRRVLDQLEGAGR